MKNRKKLLLAIAAIAAVVLLLLCTLPGCGKEGKNAPPAAVVSISGTDVAIDIDITEAVYVTSINEVYNNFRSYLGKVIRIEGMAATEDFSADGGGVYHYVYRTGPGCCGTDGAMCGFEFTAADYPADNEWIEVIATLTSYEENGVTYLSLDAQHVTVKQERGAEVVSQ